MSETQQAEGGYRSLIEPYWPSLNCSWDDGAERFVRTFRLIRPEVGNLYAAHWCQSEVRDGGFHQFFSNTTGLLAPEALVGFQAIGLVELADTLAAAMDFFGSPFPRRRADRHEILPTRPGRQRRQEWDPFYALDQRFYQWADRWEDAADAYAARARI